MVTARVYRKDRVNKSSIWLTDDDLREYKLLRIVKKDDDEIIIEVEKSDVYETIYRHKIDDNEMIAVPTKVRKEVIVELWGDIYNKTCPVEFTAEAFRRAGVTTETSVLEYTEVENDLVYSVEETITTFTTPSGQVITTGDKARWIDRSLTKRLKPTNRLRSSQLWVTYGSHTYGESRDIDLAAIPVKWLKQSYFDSIVDEVVESGEDLDVPSSLFALTGIKSLDAWQAGIDRYVCSDDIFDNFNAMVIENVKKDHPILLDYFDFPVVSPERLTEAMATTCASRVKVAKLFPLNFTARKAIFAKLQYEAYISGFGFVNNKTEVLVAAKYMYPEADCELLREVLFGEPDAGTTTAALKQIGLDRLTGSDKYIVMLKDDYPTYLIVHTPTEAVWACQYQTSNFVTYSISDIYCADGTVYGEYDNFDAAMAAVEKLDR